MLAERKKDNQREIALIEYSQRVVELMHDGWPRLRILVLGDVMLDKFIWGEAERISPEAPVPVIRATRNTLAPGGAANVAMNLAGLGVHTIAAGLIGDDADGVQLGQLLACAGIETRLIVTLGASTISKTRIVGGHQHLLRLDVENVAPSSDAMRQLLASAEGALDGIDALVLSDYAKGALTTEVCRKLIANAGRHSIPVIASPKGPNLEPYYGARMICLNLQELSAAVGMPQADLDLLLGTAQARIKQGGWDYIVVTMGSNGIAVIRKHSIVRMPARARQVFDVCGAGDTVLATMAAALTSGLDVETAAELANLAAGVVVGELGTTPIRRQHLLAEIMGGVVVDGSSKMLSRGQMATRVAEWKAAGETVVFTNGCFDLLHVGHVTLLEAARREGSRLVVAVNSDDSIRRLKGDGRPVIGQTERARMLAAMAAVDAVTIFDEDTPLACIRELQPHVIVKGAEYSESQVVGHDEVRSWNGRVKLVPMLAGFNTSALIARLSATVVSGAGK